MSNIAKTMAERIRNAAGGSSVLPAPTAPADGLGAVNERERYVLEVAGLFKAEYGVDLAEVTCLFVPRNDMVYAAAENSVPMDDFVTTLGTQMAFTPVTGKPAAAAQYIASENRMKIALAEFAHSEDGWIFSDGHAVTATDRGALVVAPFCDETVSSWQFTASVTPMEMDDFVALSASDKSAAPVERRVYGDIDDCISWVFKIEATPAGMRM